MFFDNDAIWFHLNGTFSFIPCSFFPHLLLVSTSFFLLLSHSLSLSLQVANLIQSFRFRFSWICFPSDIYSVSVGWSGVYVYPGRMLATTLRVVIRISIRYSRISNFSFSWAAERKRNSYSMHRFIIYKIIETRLCHGCTFTCCSQSNGFLPLILYWDSSFTCWRHGGARTKRTKN